MIFALLAALADPGAAPATADPALGGELFELAKVLGGGGAVTFAVLAWQTLRTERAARLAERSSEVVVRADRQRELDARLDRIATTMARIEERTAFLTGQDPTPREPAPRGARARTPAHGVRVGLRKSTESDP